MEKYNKKLTFEAAEKKFAEQNRKDIQLCKDGYLGWKNKSKFYDLIEKDYFWAIPKNVFTQLSCHPKRAVKNRSKTNIKKYGNKCSLHGTKIKEKTKETNLKRYGSENVFQSDAIKEKIKNTMLAKYNVGNISQLDSIKKIKRLAISDRYIEDTGQHLKAWINNNKEPCPSYTSLITFFKDKKIYLEDLEKYFENWKNNKTSLEVLSEKVFESKHFNKKPANIKKNYRPDFKLSETVYANVDGLYWHSEKQKDKKYHFNLRKEFEAEKLRLFQFREDEINNKPNIIKSIIANASGLTCNKIYARNTIIKKIEHSCAKKFLENNHLMGSTAGNHIGLYHDNKLVCLLSFKQKKNICKIERFCSLVNHNVVGGFSKLISHLENNLLKPEITEIHNWIDLRYGTGEHLANKGFKHARDTLGWKWTDGANTFNRLRCRANMDNRKFSEKQHAEELGWFKIYDAGQRLYIKNIS